MHRTASLEFYAFPCTTSELLVSFVALQFFIVGALVRQFGGIVAQLLARSSIDAPRVVVSSPTVVIFRPAPDFACQQYAPMPFKFAYSSEDVGGSHSAKQTNDGKDRVQGSYTIPLANSSIWTVSYVAEANGYRAGVTTNKLRTKSKNTADFIINSPSITGQYRPRVLRKQLVITQYTAAPAITQIRRVNNQMTLPSYGTLVGI